MRKKIEVECCERKEMSLVMKKFSVECCVRKELLKSLRQSKIMEKTRDHIL